MFKGEFFRKLKLLNSNSWTVRAVISFAIVSSLYLWYFRSVGVPIFDGNDDLGMIFRLAGIWSAAESTPALQYINVILGYLLLLPYSISPNFPSYAIFLILCQFTGFFSCIFVISRYGFTIISIPLSFLVLLYCQLAGMLNFQFTTVSGVLGIGGFLLLYSYTFSPASNRNHQIVVMVISGLMLIMSSLLRIDAFRLVFLLSVPIPIILFIESYFSKNRKLPSIKYPAIAAVCTGILILICMVIDSNYYSSNEDWNRWSKLNLIKSNFIDYKLIDYNQETKTEFKKIGWTENDVAMIRSWQYIDSNHYSIAKFQKANNLLPNWVGVKKITKKLEESNQKIMLDFDTNISNSLAKIWFLPWLLLILTLAKEDKLGFILRMLPIVLTILLMAFYVSFGLERIPLRVSNILWITLLCIALTNGKFIEPKLKSLKFWGSMLGVLAIILSKQIHYKVDIDNAKCLVLNRQAEEKELISEITIWKKKIEPNAVIYLIGSSFPYKKFLPFSSIEIFRNLPGVVQAGTENQSPTQYKQLEKMNLSPSFYSDFIGERPIYLYERENPSSRKFELSALKKHFESKYKRTLMLEAIDKNTRLKRIRFTELIQD